MKQHELSTALSQGRIATAFMLLGESHFLIDYYAKRIRDAFCQEAQALELYYHEYTFSAAKAHLSQASLFGGNNVVVIKSDKKIPKKELDDLIVLVKKSPDNYLLFAYYGDDFKSSFTAFDKTQGTDFIRFFHPNFNDAMKILHQETAARHLTMDAYTSAYLFNSQNGNLGLAINELDKLSLLNRTITRSDIDEQVYSLAEVKLDDLIAQLLEKKEFRATLERLLESGEDPVRIITAISTFVHGLLLFLLQMKLHGNSDSKAILGYKLPGFIESARAEQARRFKLSTFKAILTHLVQSELALKTCKSGEKEALLFAALLRLQALV